MSANFGKAYPSGSIWPSYEVSLLLLKRVVPFNAIGGNSSSLWMCVGEANSLAIDSLDEMLAHSMPIISHILSS